MSAIIKVDHLSKKYLLNHQRQEKFNSLREALTSRVGDWSKTLFHPLRAAAGNLPDSQRNIEEFWALRDVSFEVKQGERVGIIGRNGAGKSTLLKVLSRITDPTEGRITLKGRVASLLEVGTGFHPELTGRENIYLNGSILGMSKAEIRKKFDEIVAFSEVEKFLDTPVKRYSSGMYVRLAFAVAAHLEPEILIVDEVLSVGDAQFQKKCLGKMEDVGNEGRTVLFVSHNTNAIQSLCSRAILLDNGIAVYDDSVDKVVHQYLRKNSNIGGSNDLLSYSRNYYLKNGVRFISCRILNSKNCQCNLLLYKESFSVRFIVESDRPIDNLTFHVGINSLGGARIFTADSEEYGEPIRFVEPGRRCVTVRFDNIYLMPGSYFLSKLFARQGRDEIIHLQDVGEFEVIKKTIHPHTPPTVGTGLISGCSSWKFTD